MLTSYAMDVRPSGSEAPAPCDPVVRENHKFTEYYFCCLSGMTGINE